MPSKHNILAVERLAESFTASPLLMVVKFKGVGVVVANHLRSRLHKGGVKMRVVRNTLAMVAADQARRPKIKELLGGQIALMLTESTDIARTAKSVTEALDNLGENAKMELVGALQEEQIFNGDEIRQVASLPPREQLVAKLLGALNAPTLRLVTGLSGILSGFVHILSAVAENKQEAKQT